jgi:dihydroneopterin aldolase
MKIILQDIKITTTLGVYEIERLNKRQVLISLELDFDYDKTNQDQISSTINYEEILNLIKQASSVHFNLIETLCLACGQQIIQHYQNLKSCKVEVKKPFAIIGVEKISVVETFYPKKSS